MIGLILPIKTTIFGVYWSIISKNYFRTRKNPNLGSLLMIFSQSNFRVQLPDSDLVFSYLIDTITSGIVGVQFSGQKGSLFGQYFTKTTTVPCSSSRWRNCVVLINMTDNLWNYTIVCILHCDFFQTSQNLFSTKSSTWVAFVLPQKLKISYYFFQIKTVFRVINLNCFV